MFCLRYAITFCKNGVILKLPQEVVDKNGFNLGVLYKEEKMKLSFRWYGENDPVTLEKIRQIPGMDSIVTAVYDVPVGEVWSRESIAKLKKQTEDAGLNFEVIESIPVHEDIKQVSSAFVTTLCQCLTGQEHSLIIHFQMALLH